MSGHDNSSIDAVSAVNKRSFLERSDVDISGSSVAQAAPNSCWHVGEPQPVLTDKHKTHGIFS